MSNEKVRNLGEAFSSYLDKEKREYILFLPITEEENFIATRTTNVNVVGLIYSLAKSYDMPIKKLSEMLQAIEENKIVDLTSLNELAP